MLCTQPPPPWEAQRNTALLTRHTGHCWSRRGCSRRDGTAGSSALGRSPGRRSRTAAPRSLRGRGTAPSSHCIRSCWRSPRRCSCTGLLQGEREDENRVLGATVPSKTPSGVGIAVSTAALPVLTPSWNHRRCKDGICFKMLRRLKKNLKK